MGKGHEYLHRIHEALGHFETAVTQREKRLPLRDKVSLQQEVDRSREKLVKVIVDIVTEQRIRAPTDL